MLSAPRPSCAEVRRELESLALGEVDARDQALIERHVEECLACAEAARETEALLARVRRVTPHPAPGPGAARRLRAAAAVLLCAGIVAAVEAVADARRGAVQAATGSGASTPGLVALLDAQAADGSWREKDGDENPLYTVGLSGIATLGCLGAGADADRLAAADRGSAFLARTLEREPPAAADGPPGVRLRSQAAAAWALAAAAERWPERYRVPAARAVRDLVDLEQRWAGAEGGGRLDDMTDLLVHSARVQAAAAGIRLPGGQTAAPQVRTLAASRLVADANGGGGELTRLAAHVLAGSF